MLDRDGSDKTEQPTAARREEARRRGQVPRSRDLAVALSLLAAFGGLHAAGGALLDQAIAFVRSGLEQVTSAPEGLSTERLAGIARSACAALSAAVLPLAALSCGVFAAAASLQTGFAMRAELLRPDPSRVGLRNNLRRIVGARSAVRAVLTLLKFAAVGGSCAWMLGGLLRSLSAASLPAAGSSTLGASKDWLSELGLVGVKMSLALVAVAVLEYLFERWQHERDLRMTREEVEEETLLLEGSRQHKDRRRKEGTALYRKAGRKAGGEG